MKILAIRGENIASLCAPFNVDLSCGPLGDAGLFAIAGPTGAGKSTLLDTICLALFDTTPRLSERGGAAVGRADLDPSHRLAANDVRGLLSRGAGAGFAEVEFRGVDNRRYRARWDVRRSRNKAGGKLQKQSMSLFDVETDRSYGDKKTEVLAAIEERLGLTFEQFKRSAMLAQGDFAAFLHADDRNRADLLERVTGTEIYSRISRASYERTAAERKAYEALVTQAERLGRLTPEQRGELLAQLETTKAALTEAEEVHSQYSKTLAWFDDHAALDRRVTQALEDQQAAERAVTTAHPRRKHLERVIAMKPLQLPLSRRDDAVRRRTESLTAEQAAIAAHRLATGTLAQSERVAKEAAQRRATVQQAIAEREPSLAQARALDARIEDAEGAESRSKGLADAAQTALTTAAVQVTSLKQALADTEEQAAKGRVWNADNPHAARLASVIEPVQRALTTLAAAQRRLHAQDRAHPTLLEVHTKALAALDLARAEQDKHSNATSRLQDALRTARSAVAEDARPALDARQRALDAERERLTALTSAYSAAITADKERNSVVEELTALNAAVQLDEQTLATTAPLRDQATARLTEAEHSLDSFRAALSARELRSSLSPGDPCSVCGSTEHPWATDGVVSDLHKTASERVQQLKTELTTHAETLSAVQARLDTAAKSKTRLTQRQSQAESALSQAELAWSEAVAGTNLPNAPLAAEDALETERERVGRLAEDLRAESNTLNALEATLRTAQQAYDTAAAKLKSAKETLESAEAHERQTAKAVSESEAERKSAQQAADTALETVSDALGDRTGWRDRAKTDADGLRADLATEAATFEAFRTTLAQADARLADLRPQLAEAQATAKAADTDHAQKHEQAQAAATHLAGLRKTRAGLLDGLAVSDVIERQKRELEQVEDAYIQANEQHQKAVAAVSAAQGSLTTNTQQREAADRAVVVAQKVLNTALDAFHVDEQTAVSLLAHTDEWMDGETRALAALDRAVQTAETVCKERQQALQEHLEAAPQVSEEEAKAAAASAKQALEAARQAHGDHAAALRRDDEARKQGQELDDQLSEQHAIVDRWAAISDVIGSADGKLFRTFAQGLTLDALLVYANHHLHDLAPRYRLQRVPREDLALQVIDQDMGDEVRAIPSLSGGETFLTSLALALGLSSLAASETPVESLFIDEGFGTLDRDTLEVALAALDSLQASGRQVGLISHVDGLSEHIGVAIHVQKLGAGKSRVILPDSVGRP